MHNPELYSVVQDFNSSAQHPLQGRNFVCQLAAQGEERQVGGNIERTKFTSSLGKNLISSGNNLISLGNNLIFHGQPCLFRRSRSELSDSDVGSAGSRR